MRESPTNFAESVDLARRLQARETADPLINSECHSVLFEHGDAARRAIVFLHGITSSPVQFRDLGARFHARGYNVLIPRMPRHGYTDRLSHDHARLTPADFVGFASEAVEIGRGLGEHLTVAGLSVSGVVAAWCAQHRVDVDLVVLIAPAFSPFGVPLLLTPALSRIALRVPKRIHPIDPFGRIGSSTRNHRGLQSRPLTTSRTPKTFGTPFGFSRGKIAKAAPPGERKARRGLCATAA